MAKKREVILQETFTTPEQWDDAMSKQKFYVIDVYQKWCGPCKAITGLLKRIKNELGDDLLQFAIAEADSIPALGHYMGKCKPLFLFFGCGELVAIVNGCNAPLVQKTIEDSLKHEHKVQAGDAERKVIKDTGDEEEAEIDEDTDEEEEEPSKTGIPKQITVALIKPDVVENGQVDEILEKIAEAGIEVLANEQRTLEPEEARLFYQNKNEEEYFEELITYVTSGPCQVLVLTKSGSGEGVVEAWRNIIGPFDAAVAKEENPDSLRAIYGKNATANALHGSSSKDDASRELGFFFPDFQPPVYRPVSGASRKSRASARKSAKAPKRLQRTLAIIRPDALKAHKDEIMEKIHEAGFEIAMQKEFQLSKEQAEAFYKEHADQEYFDALVTQMTSGPVMALCLAHDDAISKWRDMLGPKIVEEAKETAPDSLRAKFAVDDTPVNLLHGSDSSETAEEELSKMFNIEQTFAVIKPDAISDKDKIMGKLKEAGFMISVQKNMDLSEEIAKEIYKSKEDSAFFNELVNHMTSGPTLMMVLSAENAVDKLREIMGPADPEEAKTQSPNSLRALFAKSIMENAIHSPSTKESAKEKINIVFGDVQFKWDGTVKQDTTLQSTDEVDSKEDDTLDTDSNNDVDDSKPTDQGEEQEAKPQEAGTTEPEKTEQIEDTPAADGAAEEAADAPAEKAEYDVDDGNIKSSDEEKMSSRGSSRSSKHPSEKDTPEETDDENKQKHKASESNEKANEDEASSAVGDVEGNEEVAQEDAADKSGSDDNSSVSSKSSDKHKKNAVENKTKEEDTKPSAEESVATEKPAAQEAEDDSVKQDN